MFFIGKNGTPISVVTGVTNTVDELEQKIQQVLESTGIIQSSSSAAATASSMFIANETQPNPQNSQPSPLKTPDLSPGGAAAAARLNAPKDDESQKEIEEKMKKAKELVEKKRKEKEEEEKEVCIITLNVFTLFVVDILTTIKISRLNVSVNYVVAKRVNRCRV